MSTSLSAHSLSADARPRDALPRWAQDILDAPSSSWDSGSESVDERGENQTEYGDRDVNGSDAAGRNESDDSDADIERTSGGGQRTSDAHSAVTSEIDYKLLVEDNPLEAVALLRTLFDERISGARNRELCRLFKAVKRASFSAFNLVVELQQHGTGLSEPGVLNEPFYIQLTEVCGHIAGTPELFDEHPDFIQVLIRLCRLFCDLAWRECRLCHPQTPLSPAVALQRLAPIPSLLAGACAHRDIFEKSSWMNDIVPGTSSRLKINMHSLLVAITLLERECVRFGTGLDTYFRSMCMQFWLSTDTKAADLPYSDDMPACSLWTFTPHDEDQYSSGPDMSKAIQSWVQDISATYGERVFLDRLSATLRNPELVDHRLSSIAPIIGVGLRSPTFRPFFSQTRVLSAIRCAVDRQSDRHANPDSFMTLLNQVCLFIQYYAGIPYDAEHLPERAELLVRQLDAFEIICLAVVKSVLHPQDTAATATRALHAFGCMVSALDDIPNASKEQRKYVRKSVKRHWYKTIIDLGDAVKARNSQEEADIDKQADIVAGWYAFAEEYGLDYDHEKGQYLFELKRTAQFCASTDCEFHKKMPPHPTRTCAGCSEVRYCSRACQLKDWKDGGHKARCKRLKQTAHTPRQQSS